MGGIRKHTICIKKKCKDAGKMREIRRNAGNCEQLQKLDKLNCECQFPLTQAGQPPVQGDPLPGQWRKHRTEKISPRKLAPKKQLLNFWGKKLSRNTKKFSTQCAGRKKLTIWGEPGHPPLLVRALDFQGGGFEPWVRLGDYAPPFFFYSLLRPLFF